MVRLADKKISKKSHLRDEIGIFWHGCLAKSTKKCDFARFLCLALPIK